MVTQMTVREGDRRGEGGRSMNERTPDTSAHALPRWVLWVQDNALLSCLLAAEAYLLGSLMAWGLVPNIEDPRSWGVYGTVGVVLFSLAGAAASGVALRCSVTAAAAFVERRPFLGLFNLLGLLVFAGMEIWASIAERSINLHPTPADTAAMRLLDVASLPVSPTVVFIALLLPFSTLYWGFSMRHSAPKAAAETPQERAARHEAEEAEAQHRARLAQMRNSGRGAGLRALADGLTGRNDADSRGANAPFGDGPDGAGLPGETGGDDGRVTGPQPTVAPRSRPRLAASGKVPDNLITADALRAWIYNDLSIEIRAEEALAFIKAQPTAEQLNDVQGRPWAASKAAVKRQARAKWEERAALRLTSDEAAG